MAQHTVLLVPGFFGFENLIGIRYFYNVSEIIERAFAEAEHEVEVVELSIPPTASIRDRAAKVREVIAQTARRREGLIHLIGHSTGGLDARLALSDQANLTSDEDIRCLQRVTNLVTISTPHYGTPLAAWFGTFMGKPILRTMALSLMYSIRAGKLPLSGALMLGRLALLANTLVGPRESVLRTLFAQILRHLAPERRRALIDFLTEIAADQSLLFQIAPEGVDLINATTKPPPGLRYASVLTLGPKPALSSAWLYRSDMYGASMLGLYTLLYQLAGAPTPARTLELTGAQGNRLLESLGRLPKAGDNDGIVPTLSQIWGEVIDAVNADHFDVVGHYNNPLAALPHVDWLPSGSSFNQAQFEDLWSKVSRFLLGQTEPATMVAA